MASILPRDNFLFSSWPSQPTAAAVAREVFPSEVDPNGVITASEGNLAVASDGRVWRKTGPGTTDTGWVLTLGGPE